MTVRSLDWFPSIRRAPLRRKLWIAGLTLGLFLLTLTIGNEFLPRDRAVTREMLGHDFLVFYTAGTFAREGKTPQLYDLKTIERAEFRTGQACRLEMGPSFGPWWNPPFAAWAWAPLSVMPYPDALDASRAFSLIAALIAVALMFRMLPTDAGWEIKLLVPLLMLTSMPLMQAVSHGQNTFLSLLLLTATVALWRARHALAGGAVCGLLFYKPQLGAIVAILMIASLGRRALLGVTLTGTFLALITVASMPGALSAYVEKLGPNLQWMQEQNHYMWQRHITIKGFWRLLFQGNDLGPSNWLTITFWTITTIALGGALLMLAWRQVRAAREDNASLDRLIVATIVSMPLLMPFYFDYDLVLLAIPATLFASDVLRNGAVTRYDAWLIRAWCTLYAWTLINTSVAGRLRFNLTALLLACVAVLTIQRALRLMREPVLTNASDRSSPRTLRTLGRAA